MSEDDLPTLGEAISNWLGVQLPAIPLPQTLKNLDKAIAKIVLASGENLEARIRDNTKRNKARDKISLEGMFRTEEERRKVENRASSVAIAISEINQSSSDTDAKSEIDDDWLNLFARLSEDKTSQELQHLFGRILSGEIKRPGSFSLRTLQLVATLSKTEADSVAKFLSFAWGGAFVANLGELMPGPSLDQRILMDELGLASAASTLGGLAWIISVSERANPIFIIVCSRRRKPCHKWRRFGRSTETAIPLYRAPYSQCRQRSTTRTAHILKG